MARAGVRLDEVPHFSKSQTVSWSWPMDGVDYWELFRTRKDDLVKLLERRLCYYIGAFGMMADVSQSSPRTDITDARGGVSLYLSAGAESISIKDMSGRGFLIGDELSVQGRAAGYCIGSDLLEALVPEALGPRVHHNHRNGSWSLRYPLPDGFYLIPDGKLTQDLAGRLYGYKNLGDQVEVVAGDSRQEIRSLHGLVTISDGMCEATGFSLGQLANVSWPVAKLAALCR